MSRSLFGRIQRDAHFVSRTAGDARAAQRGVLGKRIVRREVTRRGLTRVGRWMR